jgi:hypothetical protein
MLRIAPSAPVKLTRVITFSAQGVGGHNDIVAETAHRALWAVATARRLVTRGGQQNPADDHERTDGFHGAAGMVAYR